MTIAFHTAIQNGAGTIGDDLTANHVYLPLAAAAPSNVPAGALVICVYGWGGEHATVEIDPDEWDGGGFSWSQPQTYSAGTQQIGFAYAYNAGAVDAPNVHVRWTPAVASRDAVLIVCTRNNPTVDPLVMTAFGAATGTSVSPASAVNPGTAGYVLTVARAASWAALAPPQGATQRGAADWLLAAMEQAVGSATPVSHAVTASAAVDLILASLAFADTPVTGGTSLSISGGGALPDSSGIAGISVSPSTITGQSAGSNGAVQLFSTGFEPPVALTAQDGTGANQDQYLGGGSFPIGRWAGITGPYGWDSWVLTVVDDTAATNPSPASNYAEPSLVSVMGRGGAATTALKLAIKSNAPATTVEQVCLEQVQSPGVAGSQTAGQNVRVEPVFYQRMRVKFDARTLQRAQAVDDGDPGSWYQIFWEMKAEAVDPLAPGYRLRLQLVYTGGQLVWHAQGDALIDADAFWEGFLSSVPVVLAPETSAAGWHLVEVWMDRTKGAQSRFRAAIDGVTLVNHTGPLMGPTAEVVNQVKLAIVYSDSSMGQLVSHGPMSVLFDELELWDSPPGDAWGGTVVTVIDSNGEPVRGIATISQSNPGVAVIPSATDANGEFTVGLGQAGASVVTVTYTDPAGPVYTASVNVTSTAATFPPPTVTVAASAAAVSAPGAITLTATPAASDGASIASVQFLRDGTPIGAARTAAPWTLTQSFEDDADNGYYLYSARAIDSRGMQMTSAAVSVFVTIPAAPPPAGDPATNDERVPAVVKFSPAQEAILSAGNISAAVASVGGFLPDVASAAGLAGFADIATALRTGRITDIVRALGGDRVAALAQQALALHMAVAEVLAYQPPAPVTSSPPDIAAAGEVLLSIGSFVFSVGTAAHDSLKRSTEHRWSAQDRLGREPAMQYVGPASERFSLSGSVLTHWTGNFDPLEGLRTIAARGEPVRMFDHFGQAYGSYVITRIEETASELDPVGRGRKIEFNVELQGYGADAALRSVQ